MKSHIGNHQGASSAASLPCHSRFSPQKKLISEAGLEPGSPGLWSHVLYRRSSCHENRTLWCRGRGQNRVFRDQPSQQLARYPEASSTTWLLWSSTPHLWDEHFGEVNSQGPLCSSSPWSHAFSDFSHSRSWEILLWQSGSQCGGGRGLHFILSAPLLLKGNIVTHSLSRCELSLMV